jgi:branched-chain amino acid transport system ATP-binding protein
MALSVADRAYAMSKGRIVLQGTAAELAERSDLLTAGYLGGLDELADGNAPSAAETGA